MSPPVFGDLGKQTRDLFSKGFHNGFVKLDVKTVTENKVEFKVNGSNEHGTGKSEGKFEGKKNFDCGLVLTESWDTKNSLGAKVELEDKLLKGLKLTLDSSFDVSSGAKKGNFKAGYKHDLLNFQLSSALQLGAPVLTSSAVIAFPKNTNWLMGAELVFDTAKNNLSKSVVGIGYEEEDMKLHCIVKDAASFGGLVYHKVNPSTELGVDVKWVGGEKKSAPEFALAAKHKLDSDSCVSFAVDNHSFVKLGYTNTLQRGIKVTLSALVDGKALSGGDHKVGLGVDMDLS